MDEAIRRLRREQEIRELEKELAQACPYWRSPDPWYRREAEQMNYAEWRKKRE